MALAENQILEYKRHIVRSVHAEDVRKNIVQNLGPNEAFITMVNNKIVFVIIFFA